MGRPTSEDRAGERPKGSLQVGTSLLEDRGVMGDGVDQRAPESQSNRFLNAFLLLVR